jgi:tyrosyl-tRNA synthetase
MYQERLKNGEEINMREFLYPLLQAYDSVAMDVDLELGGSDQTFNMLAGRKLMKAMKGKEKFVMTTPLLSDSKGVKIGKSEGNVIGLTDEPSDLFGKIMALSDDAIIPMFKLLTDVSEEEIESFDLKKNAMELKKRMASILVSTLHDKKAAEEAEENFSSTFQKGEIPEEMEEVEGSNGELLSEVLVHNKILSSKGEWRRLVSGNAVHDLGKGENITDQNAKLTEELTLRLGKKKFVKILAK